MRVAVILMVLVLCAQGFVYAQDSLINVYPNLQSFNSATEVQGMTDGSNRILVLEKEGKLWIFDNSPTVTSARLFIDLTNIVSHDACEGGLLGCTLHPNFANNRYVYLNYTTGVSPQWYSHIVRYQVSASPNDTIIPSTAYEILTIVQPSGRCNHKGGCLRFGPDGYLYASFGDGGSGGDPDRNGQNKRMLLGKILRLNVDATEDTLHYAIPSTNPFFGNDSGFRQEIYAYGLRNPWKYSFDVPTGRLWAGDVGQDLWEEVDIIESGKNYGWNVMEGFHCYNAGTCDSTGMTPPILDYGHSTGNKCIIGGFVYHGMKMPELRGQYIYGDYVSGRVWALDYSNPAQPINKMLIDVASPRIAISSFGVDPNGEILVSAYGANGHILRLASSHVGVRQTQQSGFGITLSQSIYVTVPNSVKVFVLGTVAPGVKVSLTDEIGHTIVISSETVDAESHTINIDLRGSKPSIVSGVYFICVSDEANTATAKLIIE
ncbi:MAG TPA: PQQ-dependent sugar dehydrogenase [Candidatus Kapabacteria bacterium]|nr:PQQ-dependent sugar dehydrogenase [Candidatus Kapabacteria bacterium]